jgi:DnaJ-domain-containing protein 1
MTISSYPLAWPAGWPRKMIGGLRSGNFKVTLDEALSEMDREIMLLGGRYPVVSSNMELRHDGQMRRSQSEPADRAVAVYFQYKKSQRVFACDTFTKVRDNVRAIGLTIAAVRSIERYGASDMLERALSAFEALPPPFDPWQILGIPPNADENRIEAAFRALALQHHPDRGGSTAKMAELNRARELAMKGVG